MMDLGCSWIDSCVEPIVLQLWCGVHFADYDVCLQVSIMLAKKYIRETNGILLAQEKMAEK